MIRSLNKYEIHRIDGKVFTNEAFDMAEHKGFVVTIDSKALASKVTIRHICCCGHVFAEGVKCPNCGNEEWTPLTQSAASYKWNLTNRGKICYIDDNKIWRNDVTLSFKDKTIVITQKKILVLDYPTFNGFENTLMKEAGEEMFFKEIFVLPDWAETKKIVNACGIQKFSDATGLSAIWVCFKVRHAMEIINNFGNADPDMIITIITMMNKIDGRKINLAPFSSTNDFLIRACQIPDMLIDIISMIPMNKYQVQDRSHWDKLNDFMKKEIRNALLHRYVTIEELNMIFCNENRILDVNQNPQFAEYFRKNVLKYGEHVWDVFYETKAYSCNIKTSNIAYAANYLRNRKVKEDKIYEFAKLIESGQGIAALKALL